MSPPASALDPAPAGHPPARGVRPGGAALARTLAIGAGVLALLVVVSLAVGARSTPLGDVVAALLRPADADPTTVVVVRDLRVPRTVLGLLAGAALGAAGVVMRGVTRNPVADPGLLGVNAGAALGVVVALGLGRTDLATTVVAALLGALAAAAVVAAVAARTGSPARLVVAGAAITAGLTSVTTLLLLQDPTALDRYRFWTVGALTGRGLDAAAGVAPLVLAGLVGAVALSRPLDALALGDDVARGLGYRLGAVRAASVAVVVALAGAATALAGPLVFVGLVAVHTAHRLVGARHARMVPVAVLAGAALLVAADVVGRVVAPPGELEAGLVVAAIGAPVLIGLVRSGSVR
ncbi:iron ABC transporter permease [Actinotalea sp. M2MS4P-6]|uniref:FecCD family ABC transporter permease n=1 Tax=Actinotalea sp. M2MS4P-6 TaxID=2983762 RepID=UPI0021E41CA4|nr:iron ABC transporter permease [Actinotalea sp. M2MS4P-6]MCV2393610.1 iron ABC transporter permease [Actinotalea sp. M2MS4P-6]